jgi:hypothetical protein
MKQVLCSCGRIAELVERNTDKPLCWEAYLLDEPMKWQLRYPRDQEPRHEREEE